MDASQGVEAQTLANAYLAVENNLEIIPVINKIDLPSAQPDECKRQIEDIIGLDSSTAILASAKEGTGVQDILEAIVERFHPPTGDPDAPLKALIFDSWFDPYRGVVIVVRVIDGVLRPKMKIRLMAEKQDFEVDGLGVFSPKAMPVDELGVGEVGFVVANIKVVADAKIGDTVTETARPTTGAVSRLQGTEADGLRRPLSGREPPVCGAARSAREAAPQRRLVLLRARDLGGARLRLPLRLPRPAAHGDRAGAARARIQHGPGHHGAGRAVSRHDHRRRGPRDRQPGQAAGRRPDREARRADHHGR